MRRVVKISEIKYAKFQLVVALSNGSTNTLKYFLYNRYLPLPGTIRWLFNLKYFLAIEISSPIGVLNFF